MARNKTGFTTFWTSDTLQASKFIHNTASQRHPITSVHGSIIRLGDPAKTHKIIIDGKYLPITASLYSALRQLQVQSTVEIWVWADAICINQQDLAERSVQVQLMRQIYHNAGTVLIWLGLSSEQSWRCMSFLADLTSTCSNTSSIYPPKSNKNPTKYRDEDLMAEDAETKFSQKARLWMKLIYFAG